MNWCATEWPGFFHQSSFAMEAEFSNSPTGVATCLPPVGQSRFVIDGHLPRWVCTPESYPEISSLLKQANAKHWSVVPFGAGTKQHVGNPLKSFDIALSMERFDRIVEYEPQDLVVKVEGGCRLKNLQSQLAQDGLWLPVDPSSGGESTLGGIVSTHESGPSRFSQGTIRDYLIGITLVQPDGALTKFGSRVVKNVTGYDMCKLYTGAFGTLGVLLDFFFKLKPIPTAQNTVIVALSELSRVREIMNRIVRSSLTPMAVELLNPKAAAFLNAELDLTRQKDCYLLVLLFGDVQRSVEWQVGHVEELVQDLVSEGIKITEATGQQTLWQWIREDLPWMERTGANVKLKVNSLPSQLTDILSRLEGLGNELGAQLWIKSHAGNGIVRAFLNMENSNPIIQRFSRKLEELRSFLKPSRGTAVLEAAPEPFKQLIDVWGYEFKDKAIMRRIRERFDGGQVLNPGRFVV